MWRDLPYGLLRIAKSSNQFNTINVLLLNYLDRASKDIKLIFILLSFTICIIFCSSQFLFIQYTTECIVSVGLYFEYKRLPSVVVALPSTETWICIP